MESGLVIIDNLIVRSIANHCAKLIHKCKLLFLQLFILCKTLPVGVVRSLEGHPVPHVVLSQGLLVEGLQLELVSDHEGPPPQAEMVHHL